MHHDGRIHQLSPSPNPLTPASIQRAIEGDRRAMHRLVAELTPVIQARAARVLLRRSLTRSRDVRQDVLDMTQQSFVALFGDGARLLRSWDPARGLSLANFVGLVAEQQVLAVLRSRCKNPWLDEPVAPEDLDAAAESERGPERIAASKEALAAVLEALRDRLSDQGLAMFQWLYVEERSVDEVCALAETSEGAVYAWRSRLGKLVRQIAREVLSDRVSAGLA
jgi:DNA-directed RNA polymerase specialized sigma24 family protein